MPSRNPYPRRMRLASGWTIVGRARGHDYVAILDPQGEPRGIYYTIPEARRAIRKHIEATK